MIFSKPEKLKSITIGKNFFELEVLEAQRKNNKGEMETVKYQYYIFINGMRAFGFCLPTLEEPDIVKELKRFKWLK